MQAFDDGEIDAVSYTHLDVYKRQHVMAHFIKENEDDDSHPDFPFLCLLVSGGNSQIILVKSYNDMEIIGQTIDDAAGEAFDKCAKVIGLGYPCLLYTSKTLYAQNPKCTGKRR